MLKILLAIITGFSLFLAGFYVFFSGLKIASENGNPLVIILSFLLIAGSVLLLFKASHMNSNSQKIQDEIKIDEAKFEEKLKRNNEFINSWKQTDSTREKLKFMQYSAVEDQDDKS